MRRTLSTLILIPLALFLAAQPVGAATKGPDGSSVQRGAGLQDRDADRLSDAFEPALDRAAAEDRFDVLVTFSGRGSAASAQREVGAFQVRREYRGVHGFAATMSAS